MTTRIPNYQTGLRELRGNLEGMMPAEVLATFDRDAHQLQETHTDILKIHAGDTAPDFTLPNPTGTDVSLSELLRDHRVVLVFYRGAWCPYCNLALAQYQGILDQIKAQRATLVAVSPQNPDHSLSIQEKNGLQFDVLTDTGNRVARQYTTVFRNGDAPVATMGALGIDFDRFYDDDAREIPVPAVFVVEQNGTVSFAQTEGGDYRNRTEAADVLRALGA